MRGFEHHNGGKDPFDPVERKVIEIAGAMDDRTHAQMLALAERMGERQIAAVDAIFAKFTAVVSDQKREIAELRANVEKLDRFTRHLDKPLHEAEP